MDVSNLFGVRGLTLQGLGTTGLALAMIPWLVTQLLSWFKYSSEDRLAKGMGFEREVQSLRNENRLLRAEMIDRDAKHDDRYRICEVERDQMLRKIRQLEDEVLGFKRQLAQIGRSAANMAEEGINIIRLEGNDQ